MSFANNNRYQLTSEWTAKKKEECKDNSRPRCDECWAAWGTFVGCLVVTIGILAYWYHSIVRKDLKHALRLLGEGVTKKQMQQMYIGRYKMLD